jgi:hypothetical protein
MKMLEKRVSEQTERPLKITRPNHRENGNRVPRACEAI